MIRYRFGDVVLVPFPFTDPDAAGKRPAVVVSTEIYKWQRPDLVIMAITSQVEPASYMKDIPVREWKEAGLLHPSVIKPMFATLERNRVVQKIGRLTGKDRSVLNNVLKMLVGEPDRDA